MNTLIYPRWLIRAICLMMSLTLAGCQTMKLAGSSDTRELTEAELALREDERQFNNTVFSGLLTGAVAGGVLSAVAVLLSGGNSDQAVKAGVIGAGVGALAGTVDAYVTAKRQQANNQRIRVAEAVAADAEKDNAKLEQYLSSSDRVLAEGTTRIASMRRDLAANKITADDMQRAVNQEQKNIQSMQETLAKAQETRGQYQQASAKILDDTADKRQIDQEIQQMDKQIAQLESNIAAYAQALEVSRA